MDYFKNLDKEVCICSVCKKCKCEYLGVTLCASCMLKFTASYNLIYDRIKKYYDHPQKYNPLFVLEERQKANQEITALKKLYNLI
jgi:hypothetical protein